MSSEIQNLVVSSFKTHQIWKLPTSLLLLENYVEFTMAKSVGSVGNYVVKKSDRPVNINLFVNHLTILIFATCKYYVLVGLTFERFAKTGL